MHVPSPPPTSPPSVYVYVARCAPGSSIVTIAGAAGMPLWRSAAQRRQRRGSHARTVCTVHRSEAAVKPGLHWPLTGNNNSITHLSCDITVTAHHRSPSVNIPPVPSRPVPSPSRPDPSRHGHTPGVTHSTGSRLWCTEYVIQSARGGGGGNNTGDLFRAGLGGGTGKNRV